MSEFTSAMRLLSGGLPTVIQKITWECPAKGKYKLAGSMPVECCEPRPTLFNPKGMSSKIYDSLQSAEADIVKAGVEKWQRPDYSWAEVTA